MEIIVTIHFLWRLGQLSKISFKAFESGEKDPLMTYGTALITQSRPGEIPSID